MLRRHLGLIAAVALTVACVLGRDAANAPRLRKVDRYHLFGFDAYVYAAMAENPAFFTVAPWGYRVLSPLLVHVSSPDDVVRGFRRLSLAGLCLSGPLLFLFLRREGTPLALALLATGLFFFSPPVDEVFRNFFLAEPVGLPLLLVALLALRSPLSPPLVPALVLAAAEGAGALTKDVFIVLLPGLVATACAIHGRRAGLIRALPGTLVAVAVHLGLRSFWAPYPAAPMAGLPGADALLVAMGRILGAAGHWWAPVFACGTPLAAAALLRPAGRRLARCYGLLLALALALPFAAGIYTGTEFPADHFYTDDVPRLLMYALPMLLALALAAFRGQEGALATGEPGEDAPLPLEPGRRSRGVVALATVAAALVILATLGVPVVVLDRYRRADLRGRTDGPFVLAFCRDSLAFARRLDAGRPVMYEPRARRYRPGRSDPRHMERMRWFLREGFGDLAPYGMDEALLLGSPAVVVLPVLEPRDLVLGLELGADRPTVVGVSVNGSLLGTVTAGPVPTRERLPVPARTLFRGDNRLGFEHESLTSRVSLQVLNVRAAP